MPVFDPTAHLKALSEAEAAVADRPAELQKILEAIADELRTANLLTVAKQFDLYDVGWQARDEALRRLGFTEAPKAIGPPA